MNDPDREVQANAWDEGYAVGQTDHENIRANPYREDEGDE